MDKKTIFFIEDEKEILDLYGTQLERRGFAIENFKDGGEALAKISSISERKLAPPAVIILDLLLPDVSGLAILGEIRSRPIFDGTLVIIFTNYVSESLQESMGNVNNVLYLSKVDIAPSALLDTIERKVS